MRPIVCAVLALGALCRPSAVESIEPVGSTLELRTGVVVDPERASVYLMNPESGIDAVDLDSGRLLWRTDRAAKPLLRHEDRLVAQAEPAGERPLLRLALLSTRDPAETPRFVDVPLPGDVRASIDERMESSFDVAARVQAGALLLHWTHTGRPVSGVPGRDGKGSGRKTTGDVRIDLLTGQVDPIDEMPGLPEPEPPAAIARLVEERAIGPLRRVADVWVAIDRTTQAGKQRVRLVRWDAETREPLPDVTLFEDGRGFRSLSVDERHLLASRRDPSDGRLWQWTVYSLETGARLAEFRNEEPGARFLIAGSRLLHETNPTSRSVGDQVRVEPGRLRAVELDAGTEVWSHAIRDTRYRGSYPPRAETIE